MSVTTYERIHLDEDGFPASIIWTEGGPLDDVEFNIVGPNGLSMCWFHVDATREPDESGCPVG